MTNPLLIIVVGPTGCGKGSLPHKIIKYLHKNENTLSKSKCIFGLIDDLVEKNPHYINFVDDFVNKLKRKGKTNKEISESFMKPTNDMIKNFGDAYWTARKYTDCETGDYLVNNDKKFKNPGNKNRICNSIHDKELLNGAKERKNLVFETQGVSFPFWLMDFLKNNNNSNNLILSKYDIVLTFSTVNLRELYKRNLERAKTDMLKYLEQKRATPPRLPNINPEVFIPLLMQIISTFVKSTNLGSDWEKTRVLVFDNPTKNTTKKIITTKNIEKPIFDSAIDIDNKNRKKLNVILKFLPSLSIKPVEDSNKLYNIIKKTKKYDAKVRQTEKQSYKKTGKIRVRKIHKGPRGGKYYITKGRKIYI